MDNSNFKKYCTNGFIKHLFQHIVPISFTFLKNERSHEFVVSSFVLSVDDKWYLITAGHCLKAIEALEKEEGYEYYSSFFIDFMGSRAIHFEPLPFDFRSIEHIYIDKPDNYDYGIIVLDYLTRKNLEANGIVALNEDAWRLQSRTYEAYAVLGIPLELTSYNTKLLSVSSLLLFVNKTTYRPEGFPETETPIFYGKVNLKSAVKSISGMSGSPVFGFQHNDKGELRYWLVAVQSGWTPKTEYISACPIYYLGECLSQLLRKND